jgi:hypothetical protein
VLKKSGGEKAGFGEYSSLGGVKYVDMLQQNRRWVQSWPGRKLDRAACCSEDVVATKRALNFMKDLTFHVRWLLAAGALTSVISLRAAGANPQEKPEQPAASADVQVAAPTKLPYGVDDVLKLSQAKISDDIIISYIHNSGTVYSLEPKDIVYLRNQGVSDQVLNAIVGQRTQVAMAAQAAVAQNAAVAGQAAQQAQPAPNYVPAPVYDQSTAVEAPAVPQSTVYVIPNSAAYTGYTPAYTYPYAYYPYYYGGYYGPVISVGFGYCGHGYYHGGWHGYHGGYYGGWHGSHGGAWHGGGGIHVSSTGSHGGGGGFHGGAHR